MRVVPELLDRLAEPEVLTPDRRGYSPSDVRIIEAISRFRAGGYEERIGFTVYDTLRYKESMADLVKQEVDVLMERLAGEMDPDEAMRLIGAGTSRSTTCSPRCTPRPSSPSSSGGAVRGRRHR